MGVSCTGAPILRASGRGVGAATLGFPAVLVLAVEKSLVFISN
jgi:hypothetical protein